MLYTKGERRYTEASDAEILEASAEILFSAGLSDDAIRIHAFSSWVKAQEANAEMRELLTTARAKITPLPGEMIEAARRGVEPA